MKSIERLIRNNSFSCAGVHFIWFLTSYTENISWDDPPLNIRSEFMSLFPDIRLWSLLQLIYLNFCDWFHSDNCLREYQNKYPFILHTLLFLSVPCEKRTSDSFLIDNIDCVLDFKQFKCELLVLNHLLFHWGFLSSLVRLADDV